MLKLKGTVEISIIGAYAPTAQATDKQKDQFYNTLDNETRKAKNRGFTLIVGDFNARIQGKMQTAKTA